MPFDDSMSPDRLRRAAVHLRASAGTLRDSCTINGAWGDEYQAERRDHDEMLQLAAELDGQATYNDDINRMASAPHKPLTKEQAALTAAIFRGVAERLDPQRQPCPTPTIAGRASRVTRPVGQDDQPVQRKE